MTSGAQPTTLIFDWEVAGSELGASLDRLHAIAVLGSDKTDTASVALGIARRQARRRKVAIGDLLGDAEPLLALVPSEDPHGLADVFEYGVSIDKVARKVEGNANLHVLPSGAFMADQAEVMANRRWSRLAAGFREEQGLLIIAASVNMPNIEALVLQLDGAVLVGNMVPARLPVSYVLGAVRGPHPEPAEARPPEPVSRPKYVVRAPRSLLRIGAIIGLIVTALIATVGLWLAYRPLAHSAWAPAWLRGRGVSGDSLPLILGLDTAGIAGTDTARAASLSTAKHLGLLTALDSAGVVPYGIALITFNTRAGALLELQRNGATLRAGTFTPILIRETLWFRVVAGAYPDSAAAAALLDTLRARGTSDAGRAVIERFPYALLVERNVADTLVASRVSVYTMRGLPVYALLQSDGTARLFAGAFKAPVEATLLYEVMKTSGVPTSLVFRTGRVY